MAAILRPHPRQHLPQLALHRGLRLHPRADGGGGVPALPQREQPRRGAVLLLPQGAGGLGARRRPPVSRCRGGIPLAPPPQSPSNRSLRWLPLAGRSGCLCLIVGFLSSLSSPSFLSLPPSLPPFPFSLFPFPFSLFPFPFSLFPFPFSLFPFPFSLFFPLFRKEHKKHSAGCALLSLQKDPTNLTLQEFLKLDRERVKIALKREMSQKVTCVEDVAKHVRREIENLGS
uniref:Uncharacterized protein n=1 Tax=Calidris pygmaea TaxID=425635 RepID=A0A8C3JH12_9CHAR